MPLGEFFWIRYVWDLCHDWFKIVRPLSKHKFEDRITQGSFEEYGCKYNTLLQSSVPLDHITHFLITLTLANIVLFLPLFTFLSTFPRKLLYHGSSKPLTYYNNFGSKSLSRDMCNGFDTLPEELLSNILLRLPAESLLRCKYVCKEFNSIISSPSFINMHLNHQDDLTRLVLCCYGTIPNGIIYVFHLLIFSG